jgi:benzodiazapine receptor
VRALWLYGAQLGTKLVWCCVFFGIRSPGLGLIDIGSLFIVIVLFQKIDRLAALLLFPYAAWVAFAMVLNAAIWWLN